MPDDVIYAARIRAVDLPAATLSDIRLSNEERVLLHTYRIRIGRPFVHYQRGLGLPTGVVRATLARLVDEGLLSRRVTRVRLRGHRFSTGERFVRDQRMTVYDLTDAGGAEQDSLVAALS